MTPVAELPAADFRRPRTATPGAAILLLGAALLLAGCSSQAPHTADAPHPSQDHAAQAPPAAPPAAEPASTDVAAQPHQHTPGMEMPAAAPSHTHAPGTATHQDHDSKHGGDFFMALDDKHHLEGVLTAPDTFRVYLFDEYTKPLAKAAVARADARVTWGRADDSPETALKPSADGFTLEARAPVKITFPTELTLRIRFPGAAAGSRPELFTFPFKAFTLAPAPHKH